MFQVFVRAFPWDLVEPGVEETLDRLQGEVGISGVSVWAACEPLALLRPFRNPPDVFRSTGGFLYPFAAERYASTRCKPAHAGWARDRDVLARITKSCGERGLTMRLVFPAATVGRMAERFREAAVKNALRDVSQRSLCLLNPDVRTLLRELITELQDRYSPEALVITRFAHAAEEIVRAEITAPVQLGLAERRLLSLCFCESCRQAAQDRGVDVDRALAMVQDVVRDKSMSPSTIAGSDPSIHEGTALAAYLRSRNDALSALWSHLSDGSGGELLLDRSCELLEQEQQDALRTTRPPAVISSLTSTGPDALRRLPGVDRETVRVSMSELLGRDGQELVGRLSEAATSGFVGVEFTTTDLIPDAAMTTLRHAARFARRTGLA